MNATLEDAIALAAQKHKGQVDKAGAPYILHPLRVLLSPWLTSDDERMAAVLHDVVEDSGVTLEDLKSAGFSENVIEMVAAVTKLPSEEDNYEAFITRVLGASEGAIRVKLADLADNQNLDRLPNPTEKDRARLLRYQEATTRLTAALELSGTIR